jgi:hypothetical protein
MAKRKLTEAEKSWLALSAKVLKAERGLHILKNDLSRIKPDVLKELGLRGARDELLTALIRAEK